MELAMNVSMALECTRVLWPVWYNKQPQSKCVGLSGGPLLPSATFAVCELLFQYVWTTRSILRIVWF